jgi:hypothetical protein
MFNDLFYPNGWAYLLIKLLVLLLAVVLWYVVTAAPVV